MAVELPALAGDPLRRSGALMAGNVGLLKHASNVRRPRRSSGRCSSGPASPAGAFQTLLIGSSDVERVLRERRVAAATLTGSEAAGRAVARTAGRRPEEDRAGVGGSDPFLVLPRPTSSAPRRSRSPRAARTTSVVHRGQAVHRAPRRIRPLRRTSSPGWRPLVTGDPMDPATEVGPLATEQTRRDVAELVDDAVSRGATALTAARYRTGRDGSTTDRADGIDPTMRLYAEEAFGRSPACTRRLARRRDQTGQRDRVRSRLGRVDQRSRRATAGVDGLDAGSVTVNGMTVSYPDLPFGGIMTRGLRPGAVRVRASACSATSRRYGSAERGGGPLTHGSANSRSAPQRREAEGERWSGYGLDMSESGRRGTMSADSAAIVGQRLRQAREQAGIRCVALARAMGSVASLVSAIETGASRPSVRTLYAMCQELGLSFDVLFPAKVQPHQGAPPSARSRRPSTRLADPAAVKHRGGLGPGRPGRQPVRGSSLTPASPGSD